tara:strand:+ start:24898 stop:25107 length:210 start_codon:yes stop_codon:yes gene_type:complete
MENRDVIVSILCNPILSSEIIEELEEKVYYDTPNDMSTRGKDIEKRKNKVRNIPCPICGSGKKFKKCCW